MKELSAEALATLIKLTEEGPLRAQQLPSANGKTELQVHGLCALVACHGEDGWWAASHNGIEHYKAYFSGVQGRAMTINEAKANRQLQLLWPRLRHNLVA